MTVFIVVSKPAFLTAACVCSLYALRSTAGAEGATAPVGCALVDTLSGSTGATGASLMGSGCATGVTGAGMLAV